MRDTSEYMIELLDAFIENEMYFSTIKLILSGETFKLRFGIEAGDYTSLKKLFYFRPFENTGVAPYKYFYSGSYGWDYSKSNLPYINVRVEQLGNHKQFAFNVSKNFIANLRWFEGMEDISSIKKFIIP